MYSLLLSSKSGARCFCRTSPPPPPLDFAATHQAAAQLHTRVADGQPASRRAQALNGAWAVEARASRTYQQGVGILSTAVDVANASRTLAAGAEAKVGRGAPLFVAGLVFFRLRGTAGLRGCTRKCLLVSRVYPFSLEILSMCTASKTQLCERPNSNQAPRPRIHYTILKSVLWPRVSRSSGTLKTTRPSAIFVSVFLRRATPSVLLPLIVFYSCRKISPNPRWRWPTCSFKWFSA